MPTHAEEDTVSFAASFNDESPFLVTRHKVIRIAGVCALFYCTFVIGMAHAGTGAST